MGKKQRSILCHTYTQDAKEREVDSIVKCAEKQKCSHLLIVTMNEKRVIEKNGY